METRSRLTELDAMRGIAALLVVGFHYSVGYSDCVPGARSLPFRFFWGEYGVQLFFAISGFVIFMTLNSTKHALDFIVSRFSRLYPAYWAAMLMTTFMVNLIGPGVLHVSTHDFAANLGMFLAFSDANMVDPSYWTLSVELLFYGHMLALRRLNLLPRIESVLGLWIALKWFWMFDVSNSSALGFILLVHHIPFFALGIIGYRIWSGARTWTQQLPLAAIAFASVVAIDPIDLGIIWLITAALVACLVCGRLTFLNRGPLLWLGGISYTLYLLHQCIGYAIMSWLDQFGLPVVFAAGVALGFSLLLAHILTRLVERPALDLIRKAWSGRRDALATA
jgi:peptidoglycan/LPS O-acetylase OafA/YrhL